MYAKANLQTLALSQFLRAAQPRQEALAILADLGRDIFTALTPDSEWQMEVADGGGKPIFRPSLLAEWPDQEGAIWRAPKSTARRMS